MREMKDSGVEWIGKIPASWSSHPLFYYFDERKNRNFDLRERNLLSLSYGNIIRKDINTTGGLLPASFNTYNIVKNLDIIIRPTDLQNDKKSLRTGLVKEKIGIITSAYIALKPREGVFSNYFHYLLHSYDIMKVFYNMGNGVRQGLNYSEFSKLILVAPSLDEQHKIADFLDKKCAEIDALTADIQTQIDTLEEYKKSVITEAVTKGLDPSVEMKDSGVEWLEKIPINWKISRVKFVANFYNGDRSKNYPSSGDIVDIGIYFLTANNIHDLGVDVSCENSKFITPEKYSRLGGAKIKVNDLIFCLRGSVGNCAINKSLNCGTVASSLVAIRSKKIIPSYLNYIMNSPIATIQTMGLMNGSCAANLSAENVARYYFTEPPIDEQHEIADFLDQKCSKIDQTISEKQQQLETLAEYKKSLIYEYVTGKKEVD